MATTDIQPLMNYIKKVVSLTPDQEHIIAAHVISRTLLKGQFIVQQGDVCRVESFILSGAARTFYVDDEGTEHIVMLAIENWWTADLGSFISQTPADYNVQCLEKTKVIQFEYGTLEKLYQLVPPLERFFRIIIQRAFVAAQKRVVRNISLSAKDRYDCFCKEYPQLEQRIPQYMIASYLGITKEFLSKLRNQGRSH